MGKVSIVPGLIAFLLTGLAGVALAQQGLIIEPWRKSPARVSEPAAVRRPSPESGLGLPQRAPASSAPAALQPAAGAPAPLKWLPPVVELLVDPWAKDRNATPSRPTWVPSNGEIVDPWAEDAPEPPRVASAPSPRRPSVATIF